MEPHQYNSSDSQLPYILSNLATFFEEINKSGGSSYGEDSKNYVDRDTWPTGATNLLRDKAKLFISIGSTGWSII